MSRKNTVEPQIARLPSWEYIFRIRKNHSPLESGHRGVILVLRMNPKFTVRIACNTPAKLTLSLADWATSFAGLPEEAQGFVSPLPQGVLHLLTWLDSRFSPTRALCIGHMIAHSHELRQVPSASGSKPKGQQHGPGWACHIQKSNSKIGHQNQPDRKMDQQET